MEGTQLSLLTCVPANGFRTFIAVWRACGEGYGSCRKSLLENTRTNTVRQLLTFCHLLQTFRTTNENFICNK